MMTDCISTPEILNFSENSKIISRNNVEKVLGVRFYKELSECRELLQLDNSLDGFFEKVLPVLEGLRKKDKYKK